MEYGSVARSSIPKLGLRREMFHRRRSQQRIYQSSICHCRDPALPQALRRRTTQLFMCELAEFYRLGDGIEGDLRPPAPELNILPGSEHCSWFAAVTVCVTASSITTESFGIVSLRRFVRYAADTIPSPLGFANSAIPFIRCLCSDSSVLRRDAVSICCSLGELAM